MPGLDRTGPEGQGSRTGRQMGRCNPDSKPAADKNEAEVSPRGIGLRRGGRASGIGRGRGKGQGRGFGK